MKKTFMLVSALAMVAMSIAVTSCKKDKDEVANECVCDYNVEGSMRSEVFSASDLKDYGVNSCSALESAILRGYGAVEMTVHCR